MYRGGKQSWGSRLECRPAESHKREQFICWRRHDTIEAKCSFVWYKNLDRSFFHFVRDHACDRHTDRRTDSRTDGQTEFSSLDRVCISCSAVKTEKPCHSRPTHIAYWWQSTDHWKRIDILKSAHPFQGRAAWRSMAVTAAGGRSNSHPLPYAIQL